MTRPGLGKSRSLDALDAILAGKPVAAPQHEAQGCKIGGMK